jgi:hypothetical protein
MKGLWSVKMGKQWPFSMYRKCLMLEWQAKCSLSKAENFCWAASSFFEQNPRGCQPFLPGSRYWRHAPTSVAEASTTTDNSVPTVGWTR